MTTRKLAGIFATATAVAIAGGTATSASAASIYVQPVLPLVFNAGTTIVEVDRSPRPVAFQLMMDFSAAESTVGGGIDIDVANAGTFISFVPSNWFTTVPDAAFSGHGTLRADNDYEVHFGSFGGLSGLHELGTLTINLSGSMATIALAPNQFFGGFYSAATALPMDVQMTGATVAVVPEPQVALMLLAGLGVLGAVGGRRLSTR